MSEQHDEKLDEKPPILGTWNRLYVFVLLLHAIIIALFVWFTYSFS